DRVPGGLHDRHLLEAGRPHALGEPLGHTPHVAGVRGVAAHARDAQRREELTEEPLAVRSRVLPRRLARCRHVWLLPFGPWRSGPSRRPNPPALAAPRAAHGGQNGSTMNTATR